MRLSNSYKYVKTLSFYDALCTSCNTTAAHTWRWMKLQYLLISWYLVNPLLYDTSIVGFIVLFLAYVTQSCQLTAVAHVCQVQYTSNHVVTLILLLLPATNGFWIKVPLCLLWPHLRIIPLPSPSTPPFPQYTLHTLSIGHTVTMLAATCYTDRRIFVYLSFCLKCFIYKFFRTMILKNEKNIIYIALL